MIKCLIPEYPSIHYNYDRREGSPESLDGLTDDEGQQHPFISPRDLPGYGTWSGHDAPSNAMSLEEKDTDLLMEYFAGWAL
jgi:chromo domain-containing protein 1